jgi:hypothetical protein
MIYLLAIFISPLALLLEGRPFSAMLNGLIWLLSVICWITIIFHHAGFVLWLVALVHAVLVINSARQDRRARWIADSYYRR